MKTKLKNQILDLLNRSESTKLIYMESDYYVLRAGELVKVPDNEVLILLPDSEVLAFFVNKKQWIESSGSFEGAEVEPLPEILKDKKVLSIEVESIDTAKAYLELTNKR